MRVSDEMAAAEVSDIIAGADGTGSSDTLAIFWFVGDILVRNFRLEYTAWQHVYLIFETASVPAPASSSCHGGRNSRTLGRDIHIVSLAYGEFSQKRTCIYYRSCTHLGNAVCSPESLLAAWRRRQPQPCRSAPRSSCVERTQLD